MIVITHFAVYCLTFVWQYLKNYGKIYEERSDIALKDVEQELDIGLTLNKFGNENIYEEINAVVSNNLEDSNFLIEEQDNFVEVENLSNTCRLNKSKHISHSKTDFVKSNLYMQKSVCNIIDSETVASSEKFKNSESSENQCINDKGFNRPYFAVNKLESLAEPDSQVSHSLALVYESTNGEVVTNQHVNEDINTTALNDVYNQELTVRNVTKGSQDYENLRKYHYKDEGLDQDLDINHGSVIAKHEFCKNNDYFNDGNAQESSFSETGDIKMIPIAENSVTDVEVKTDLRFYPPVFVQRYVRAGDVLDNKRWKNSIKKVVEFGCAEMTFFTMVLKYKQVAEIVEVDIDYDLLDRYINKITPKPSDFLNKRSTPLTVKVYSGNVAQINNCLMDTDAVIAIELIEHLYPNDLEGLPFTIFGFMQPRVVLFTTPNADFNVLFPNFSGFRHYDHKFEWTRKQFEDWAHNLVTRYPDYQVSFEGIGEGPEGTEALGCCSQMALFERKTESKIAVDIAENKDLEGEYKLVHDTDYPFYVDTRTEEQKIVDAAESYIYSCCNDRWHHDDEIMTEVPLKDVLSKVKCLSLARLRDLLLKAKWEIVKSSTGDLMVRFPEEKDDSLDWQANDDEQNEDYKLPVERNPVEENWDNFECDGGFDNEPKPQQSEDTVDCLFNSIEEIESSTENCHSKNDTTLENELSLNKSSESDSITPVYASSLTELNSSPNVPKHSIIPQLNQLCSLPTYIGQQVAFTPLNTPHGKSVYRNLSCVSDCINDSNISMSGTDVSNMYASCSDGSESEIFYTPMPSLKHLKQHGPIPSFKNGISADDLNESEDSLSPSDNVSFTNLKIKIPKYHSCPGSRQSVSADELQRGNSCDILACQQDSTSISKAGDSGYPNSEQTMDMDLTPEQVDELFTESDSSLGCDDNNSLPESPVNPAIGQVIALLGDNVENGDVANNNRDGEGNNAIGEIDGAPFEFEAIIDEREEVHPLLAAVEGDLDSSDNELLDENKNSGHNENDEIQNGGNVSVSQPSSVVDSKFSVKSDLTTTKSEPILVDESLEKGFSNELSSSISDQTICFKIMNDKDKLISPTTSLSVTDTNTSINLSPSIVKSDPLLIEKASSQLFNEIVLSHTDHTTKTDNIKRISSNSNSVLSNDPSFTKLELSVNKEISNKSVDQFSFSPNDQPSSSNQVFFTTNNKTKEISANISSHFELENVEELNSVVCSDQDDVESESIITGKQSDLMSTALSGYLHVEHPLASSSPAVNDLPDCELNSALSIDQNGINFVKPAAKKILQMSYDDLSSSSDETIGFNELSHIESGESIDLTPLPSACAIMEDLSIKDSQMTLCSEISSTVESNVFETSSESSFHELLPDCFGFNQLDSDIYLPEDANPFPEWLLSILNSYSEDNLSELGFGDVEEEDVEVMDGEREGSYDVEGDLGGSGDPNLSQS